MRPPIQSERPLMRPLIPAHYFLTNVLGNLLKISVSKLAGTFAGTKIRGRIQPWDMEKSASVLDRLMPLLALRTTKSFERELKITNTKNKKNKKQQLATYNHNVSKMIISVFQGSPRRDLQTPGIRRGHQRSDSNCLHL